MSEVDRLVFDIASGAKEQSLSLREVNSTVTEMDGSTQQNAAMAEETTTASRNLAERAEELVRLVGQFSVSDDATEPAPARANEANWPSDWVPQPDGWPKAVEAVHGGIEAARSERDGAAVVRLR